jgi:hypothetical protein
LDSCGRARENSRRLIAGGKSAQIDEAEPPEIQRMELFDTLVVEIFENFERVQGFGPGVAGKHR